LVGKRVNRLAKIVKKEWHNFDQKDRDFLVEFAYDLIEQNNTIWNLPKKFWSLIYLLIIKITGEEKEFLFCVNAVDCLVDNILDAIETENINYQKILSETLKEVKENPKIPYLIKSFQI